MPHNVPCTCLVKHSRIPILTHEPQKASVTGTRTVSSKDEARYTAAWKEANFMGPIYIASRSGQLKKGLRGLNIQLAQ